MAVYSILPDTLDVLCVRGDELSMMLEFDQDLTGYTFETAIYLVTRTQAGQPAEVVFQATNFTITPVDAAAGKINLSLNETETLALGLTPGASYRWYLKWIAPGIVTRTVISGTISARWP